MDIMDAFSFEDKVEIKISDFCKLVEEAVKADFLLNAIALNVPNEYIKEMVTGRKG